MAAGPPSFFGSSAARVKSMFAWKKRQNLEESADFAAICCFFSVTFASGHKLSDQSPKIQSLLTEGKAFYSDKGQRSRPFGSPGQKVRVLGAEAWFRQSAGRRDICPPHRIPAHLRPECLHSIGPEACEAVKR